MDWAVRAQADTFDVTLSNSVTILAWDFFLVFCFRYLVGMAFHLGLALLRDGCP